MHSLVGIISRGCYCMLRCICCWRLWKWGSGFLWCLGELHCHAGVSGRCLMLRIWPTIDSYISHWEWICQLFALLGDSDFSLLVLTKTCPHFVWLQWVFSYNPMWFIVSLQVHLCNQIFLVHTHYSIYAL
jgi:hypothetical protein